MVGFFLFGLVWFCVEMAVLVIVEGTGFWCECDMPSVPGEMCFGRMDGGGIKGGREGGKEGVMQGKIKK